MPSLDQDDGTADIEHGSARLGLRKVRTLLKSPAISMRLCRALVPSWVTLIALGCLRG